MANLKKHVPVKPVTEHAYNFSNLLITIMNVKLQSFKLATTIKKQKGLIRLDLD